MSGGARVLDVFAYSGGFSVYAASGGAQSVLSLDQSAPALEAARANMALNNVATPHETRAADAFDGMTALRSEGREFDLIVVDPPAFASQQSAIPGALNAYARLTALALDLLSANGVLVMASCSSRVSAPQFYDTVLNAARAAGRPLHTINRAAHALDHPISFPEGEYLKCLFARAP